MKRIRLFSVIILFVLSVAVLGFGIYAASTVSLTANGTIAFKSNDVKATIECYVGDVDASPDKEITFTDSVDGGTWDGKIKTGVSSYAIPSFVSNTVGSNPADSASYSLTLKFKVTNNSSRTAYVYFEGTSGDYITFDTKTTSVSGSVVNVSLTDLHIIRPSNFVVMEVNFTIPAKKLNNDVNNLFTKDDAISYAYNLVLTRFAPDGVVPVGYQQIEYIESSGTQYIDTGYVYTTNKYDILVTAETSVSAKEMCLVGCPVGAVLQAGWDSRLNGLLDWQGGGSGGLYYTSFVDAYNNKLNFHIWQDATKRYFQVNDANTLSDTNVNTNVVGNKFNIATFNANSYRFTGKIYGCKMYDNEVLVRNYIPCIRLSDNQIGLFDCVSGELVTNSGAGDFVAGPQVANLPSEYQEVEYIESTGTQYINTGVTGEIRYVADFQFTTAEADYYWKLIGSTGIGTGRAYSTEVNYSSNTRVYSYASGAVLGSIAFDTQVHSYDISFDLREGDTDIAEWKIFKDKTKGRLFGMKIYQNDVLVRNFVPCYRKADNVIGLYDLINGVFYTNAGTGTFSKGELTNLPSEYQEVEYIRSTGNQYINTGYVVSSENLRIEFEATLPASYSGLSLFGSNYSRYDIVPYHIDSYGTGVFKHWVGSSSGILSVTYLEGVKNSVVYTLNSNTLTCNINGSSSSIDFTGSIISGTNFYIFGKNGGGSHTEKANGYFLHGLKLYDNNVLVRNFVPCYRKSDNVIGLYDLANGVFYTNAGTGTFTKGSNI